MDERAVELGGEWPPPGATPIDIDDLYDQLAGIGFEYGPMFQVCVARGVVGERSLPR